MNEGRVPRVRPAGVLQGRHGHLDDLFLQWISTSDCLSEPAADEHAALEQTLTIETFEQKMHLETIRTDYRFVHLSPQVWFLQLDGCRVPRARS